MPGPPIGRGEGALVTIENEKAQGVRAESDQLKLELEASRLKFIHTELDLGHTFLQVALMTADPLTRERNVENATKAHDAAVKFLHEQTMMRQEQRQKLESALARLKQQLETSDPS